MKKGTIGQTKKNYFYQILYQLLISLLPFITSPYLSRVIGAEAIGIYSYTFSVIAFFQRSASLGIDNYGNRLIAQNRDDPEKLNHSFWSLYAMHAVLTVGILFIYAAYIIFFVNENRMIAILQTLYLVGTLVEINWLFYGLEQFKLNVVRNALLKILTAIAIFVFVKEKSDLWKYVLILSGGSILAALAVWAYVPRFIGKAKFAIKDMFSHLKSMSILFFAVIAVLIFSYMDKLMLGNMSSMTELGYYENAWKLIEFPVGFITALGTVMLPRISNLIAAGNMRKANEYFSKSMRFSMILAFAVAFGVAAIAPEFSVVFWGDEFAPCGTLMQVLAITIVLMSWNGVIRSEYLIPRERDKIYVAAVASGAGVNLIANYLLIPQYGAVGAAIGTVLAYVSICLVQTFYSLRDLAVGEYMWKSVPYLICGIVMYVGVRIIGCMLQCRIITVIIEVAVGVVCYAVFVMLYALIFKDSFVLDMLKELKHR